MADSEVAAEMAETRAQRPGQYEASVEFTKFEVPGMPASMLAEMRGKMEGQTAVKTSYCLTEEAAASSQRDRLRQMSRAQGDCAFERFEVDGDAIDARLACTGMPGNGSATMTMAGTMGREASSVRVSSVMSNPATPGINATIDMQVDTRRTGDCTAASRAEAERIERELQAAPKNAAE
jgi:hypothetical protein